MRLHIVRCKSTYACQTVSRLFQPVNVLPKDAVPSTDFTCKSQKLMIDVGIVQQEKNGMFSLLPLGVRALEKLVRLLDSEMQSVGAQKILLPSLTTGSLWKTSGRWTSAGPELMKLTDRQGKEFVLSPTHEEAITNLIASVPRMSHHQLPMKLYQISTKFRDEMKPRFGLLRAKEFIMKDLYTFDANEAAAKTTYEEVCSAYEKFLNRLQIRYVKVLGDQGIMGGSISHEYQIPAEIGEDHILSCEGCGIRANAAVAEIDNRCSKCGGVLQKENAIEVGHTFLLGHRYSEPLKAHFTTAENKQQKLYMGCYGLGVSRVLAASIEALSSTQEIQWPIAIAPYRVCVIGPKKGSKEDDVSWLVPAIIEMLQSIPTLRHEVIVDDRTNATVGKRMLEARRVGYPFVVIVGKTAKSDVPLIELHDTVSQTRKDINLSDLKSVFVNLDTNVWSE